MSRTTALRTVTAFHSAADRSVLAYADALVELVTGGMSYAEIGSHITGTGTHPRGSSKGKISLYVTVRKSLPADVTAAEYVEAYRVKATANRGTPKAAPVTGQGESVTGEGSPTGNAPTADPALTVATLTDAQAVRLLWELAEAHGDRATFQAALRDVTAFLSADFGVGAAMVAA